MSNSTEIQFFADIQKAGFTIVDVKTVPPSLGSFWQATLAYGDKPIFKAWNDGKGGIDQYSYLNSSNFTRDEQLELMMKFWREPAVIQSIRESMIEDLDCARDDGNMTEAAYALQKQRILSEPPLFHPEHIGTVICNMTNAYDLITVMRRALKYGICFATKEDMKIDRYTITRLPDTPENRNVVKTHIGPNFGCFIADMLQVLPDPPESPESSAKPNKPKPR